MFRIAWAGFAVNLLTGLALFMANARNLAQNPPFLIKISCICLGGLCLTFLWRRVTHERAATFDAGLAASGGTKALACATLACWMVAIMAGRIIAYTIKY